MGTRGLIGFRMDGKDKLTYNHFDSYPSGVGVDVLNVLRNCEKAELVEAFNNITLIDGDSKPTLLQKAELQKYTNLEVSNQSDDDWYCLTRNAQGNLRAYIHEGLRFMVDSQDFIKDSLFCEWAYIVNLDTGMLEVWKGWQRGPTKDNRYGTQSDEGGYYPCKLIKEYSLKKLPSAKRFIKELED